jgi:hypothetical protein
MRACLNGPWIFGLFGISFAAGIVDSFLIFIMLLVFTPTRLGEIVDREWIYSGFLTGIMERFFFTVVIGLLAADGSASSVVSTMVGWIAIKGQAHYRLFSEPANINIPKIYLGLLGSLGSLLFAVGGGFAWTHHWTLDHFLAFLGWLDRAGGRRHRPGPLVSIRLYSAAFATGAP